MELATFNPYIPFLTIILLMVIILLRAHLSSKQKFNFYDVITDSSTRKASLEKILVLTGGVSITWWFMDLSSLHKATWEDAIAFGGLLGLSKVADKLINSKYSGSKITDEDSKDKE
jgi:hypothetical protein